MALRGFTTPRRNQRCNGLRAGQYRLLCWQRFAGKQLRRAPPLVFGIDQIAPVQRHPHPPACGRLVQLQPLRQFGHAHGPVVFAAQLGHRLNGLSNGRRYRCFYAFADNWQYESVHCPVVATMRPWPSRSRLPWCRIACAWISDNSCPKSRRRRTALGLAFSAST